MNAANLVLRSGGEYAYVEGYAAGIFAVQHAWAIDRCGKVVDPTWSDMEHLRGERAYFGIAFDTDYLMSALARRKVYGLLTDEKRGSRLISGKDQIEKVILRPDWLCHAVI